MNNLIVHKKIYCILCAPIIFLSIVPVSFAGSYAVWAGVQACLAGSYTVWAGVPASLAGSYTVCAAVPACLAGSYTVCAGVPASLAGSYVVSAGVLACLNSISFSSDIALLSKKREKMFYQNWDIKAMDQFFE